jgi:capsid protein
MARRTPLEAAETRARIAQLRRDAEVADLVSMRAKALSSSFTDAKRTRLRPGSLPPAGSGQAHRDRWTREKLRRECQQLLRNNPIAIALVERVCDLVVGDGPRLACLSGDEAWNEEAQRLFAEWSEEAEITGRHSLADCFGNALTACHTDGRLLWIKASDGGEGRLQEIEDERIGRPTAGSDTDTLKGGVEINAAGRPTKYWITEWRGDGANTTTEARGIDARFVIELANPRVRMPGVYAPEPILSSVIHELELLDDSVESTALAYRIATMLAMVIKTANPADTLSAFVAASGADGDYTTTPASGDPTEFEWQPGSTLHLAPGEEAGQITPEHPATGVDKYAWMMVQIVGARLGVPVDLSHFVMDGNYSATRARLAVAWRAQAATRRMIGRAFRKVARWKLTEWVNKGVLPEVEGWDRFECKLAPMLLLDPKAEIETRLAAIDGLLLDYQTASDELGLGDWAGTVRSRDKQRELLAAAGLEAVRPGAPKGTPPGALGTDGQPVNTGG